MALPKLNLRDLFWLLLVAALSLGWWLDSAGAISLRLRVQQLLAQKQQLDERENHLIQSILPHLEQCKLVLVHTVNGWEMRHRNDSTDGGR